MQHLVDKLINRPLAINPCHLTVSSLHKFRRPKWKVVILEYCELNKSNGNNQMK